MNVVKKHLTKISLCDRQCGNFEMGSLILTKFGLNFFVKDQRTFDIQFVIKYYIMKSGKPFG